MKLRSLLLPLCTVFSLGLATAAPGPEKLLTADTLAVVTIPDMNQARTKAGQWPYYRLWHDAAMKPFRDKVMTKFKADVVAPMERQMGMKWEELAALAQGQVTLAVTQGTWDGASEGIPGFVVIIDAKEKSEALQTHLAQLKKKWIESGKQLRTEKIRDVEFSTLIYKDSDVAKTLEKAAPGAGGPDAKGEKPPPSEKKNELFVGQSDSLLIIGTIPKDLEKVLVRQSGGAVPSLGEQGSFAASYPNSFRDALAYGWVNLATIVSTVTKLAAAENKDGAEAGLMGIKPEQMISAFGLQGLESGIFAMKDLPEGCFMEFGLNIPASKRKGIFKLFALEPLDANPPPFVPADAIKFTRIRLDIPKTWSGLEALVGEVSPQMSGIFKMLIDSAGKDKDPNFDLRKNLIANLGNDIISYQKSPRRQTLEDLAETPGIWLVGSPQPEQLAAALKSVSSLMPNPNLSATPKEREFLGRKVYSMALPPVSSEGGKKIDRTLHYAASGSYVALSTEEAMLEEFLRSSGNPGKSLRETAGLTAAAEKVGGMSTGLFGYQNQKESMRATFEVLKKESGTLENLFSNSPLAGKVGNNQFKDWVDFSLLPDFDRVSKYLHFNVWAAGVTPEGFRFRGFSPTPPQAK